MTTTLNPSVSRCNVCRDVIVREHVPWNNAWFCNGEHKRCTMIGCVPVLTGPPPPVNPALAVRADGVEQGSPAPPGW